MKLIPAVTIADGWVRACQHLRSQRNWTDTTVVVHVSEPARVRQYDKNLASLLDTFLVAHRRYSNHTVAETIFPGYEYVHRGVSGVYEVYPKEIYPKIEELSEVRWGTYAQRILRRQGTDGREFNPLEQCIKKMRDRGAKKRAVYEIGLGFDLAVHDDCADRGHRMGGPCLSHLSFKLIDRGVHLTAVYRLHHYIERAYGNLLGLARLQSFVADQLELPPGPLVCHSTLARLDFGRKKQTGWLKTEVSTLLDRAVEVMTPQDREQGAAEP